MSEQQQGGSRAPVPALPVGVPQNGLNGFPPASNPFTSSALRALPPLPHPDLLADASSALLVDLRRQMDHLSRLADKIEQHGLGEAPPPPPSSIALVPIPHVPAPPTLSHKPAIIAAAAAAQTVRARIKRRPKPSGRYSGEMVHLDGSSGQHALRGGEGMAAGSSGLQRVVNRFNAIQAAQYAAESSAMGAARSTGSVCRIEMEVGRSDTLRIAWNGLEDKASKQGIRPKRRRTDHHRLTAQVRLDVGEMHEANAEIAAIRRVVRTIRFKPSQTSASDPTASEHLLANLLSSQHLSLAELLDRLPHLPTILSSPCIFCSRFIRPPDGLPLQGTGFLPEKHAKITMSPQSSQSEHLTNGQMMKTDLTKTVGNTDLDEAEATGKDDRNQREAGVEDGGGAKGDSKAHRQSGVGRESSGRWVNWHACCDV